MFNHCFPLRMAFLLLLCWVTTFYLYAPSSIVVILSIMCIVPKFSLIDSWSWFHLFLNYLYLVALLNLKVSYAFMFCYSMRDKLKTICYVFPYDLNTRLIFIVSLFMIFCLCSFSCYNKVAKFLLSRSYLSCPCFKFFDPSSQRLHIWSRLCRCMSPKKLFLLLSLIYSRTSRS
jgi:hypothetical protein